MTPYERVRQSRELTAATFPLPGVLDCIRYAITELAEYDDALLRAERTGDKRNNDKAHDPRSELGQALYMLLSAAIQLRREPKFYMTLARNRVTLYVDSLYRLANLLEEINLVDRQMVTPDGLDSAIDSTCYTIFALASLHGWPVDTLIDDTCAAFEAKHAPAREAR